VYSVDSAAGISSLRLRRDVTSTLSAYRLLDVDSSVLMMMIIMRIMIARWLGCSSRHVSTLSINVRLSAASVVCRALSITVVLVHSRFVSNIFDTNDQKFHSICNQALIDSWKMYITLMYSTFLLASIKFDNYDNYAYSHMKSPPDERIVTSYDMLSLIGRKLYLYIQGVSKGKLLISLFINLADVDRFSEFYHHWIQQEICSKMLSCFPSHITYVATLVCET